MAVQKERQGQRSVMDSKGVTKSVGLKETRKHQRERSVNDTKAVRRGRMTK